MTRIEHVGVHGAGAWGTALAIASARAGRRTTLVGRDASDMAAISISRVNPKLPGATLPESIEVCADAGRLDDCGAILLAAPAQALRDSLTVLSGAARERPLAICAKGIERSTHAFLSEVVAALAPRAACAALSGPSFAADVAAGLPTAVTLAASEEPTASALAEALHGPSLRLYVSTDLRGVEIGGAAKNVLAIACGVAEGLSLGASARAALVARGFAELRRFGEACGARPETLMGLSGLGDLVLTATSAQSRNFSFGLRLARGGGTDPLAATVEGVHTARALLALAAARKVEMPIVEAVCGVLEGRLSPKSAVGALLARPMRTES